MTMDRYAETFKTLRQRREGAFCPFTVLGDPEPETSLAVLEAFAKGGADMLELGIPFSDPVADGPTIQDADKRALDAGITPPMALDIVARFREGHPDMPIGLLLYANLLFGPGLDNFYRLAAKAGVDSILVADLPLEESAPFRQAADRAGVKTVFLVTPLSSVARLKQITAFSGPYLYVVTRSGVTGADEELATTAAPLIKRINGVSNIPTLLGFGISRPEHVRKAIAAGADGAISGSAVVKVLSKGLKGRRQRLGKSARSALTTKVQAFVQEMKAATRRK